MPTIWGWEPCPHAMAALRKECELIALGKGLTRDSRKFNDVVRRHMAKRYHTLPTRDYTPVKKHRSRRHAR